MIIGVNTFLSSKDSPTVLPKEVIRATEEEKEAQIRTVENPAIRGRLCSRLIKRKGKLHCGNFKRPRSRTRTCSRS